MTNQFTTKAGTVLPLISLKGKQYLQVAHRLVWFREEKPDWSITTEFVEKSATHALAKAVIANEKGLIVATAHKLETQKGFQDFHEKAETGAIGRALAMCGYGTQFAEDLDEGERIVDAPQPLKTVTRPGQWTIPMGKYMGRQIEEVDESELKQYCNWLVKSAKEKGKDLGRDAAELILKVKECYGVESHV